MLPTVLIAVLNSCVFSFASDPSRPFHSGGVSSGRAMCRAGNDTLIISFTINSFSKILISLVLRKNILPVSNLPIRNGNQGKNYGSRSTRALIRFTSSSNIPSPSRVPIFFLPLPAKISSTSRNTRPKGPTILLET